MKDPEITIDFEDILKQIRSIENSAEGFSSKDMSDHTGMSRRWCRDKIGQLIKNRVLVFSGNKKAIRIDGKTGNTPVYKIKGKK